MRSALAMNLMFAGNARECGHGGTHSQTSPGAGADMVMGCAGVADENCLAEGPVCRVTCVRPHSAFATSGRRGKKAISGSLDCAADCAVLGAGGRPLTRIRCRFARSQQRQQSTENGVERSARPLPLVRGALRSCRMSRSPIHILSHFRFSAPVDQNRIEVGAES